MEIELLRGYLKKTGKTAIAWLQEICHKQSCRLPRYDDKDVTPHKTAPPQFEVKVTLDFGGQEFSASGIKCKKKDAKEEAATQLLYKMNITPKDLHDMQSNTGKRSLGGVSQMDNNKNGKQDVDLPSATLTALKPDVVMDTPSVIVMPTASTENPLNFSGQCYVDLNILCEKRQIPAPEYEEVKDEGPGHCKTFGVLCRVRPLNCKPIEVTGESNQKKKAKHLAACMMLEKLQDFTTIMKTPSVIVMPTAPTENPLNFSGQCYVDLNILCEKRQIPAPEYEEVKDEGPSHRKTFGVLCRVRPVNCNPIEVTGESNQKKKAKRLAASMMLEKLQNFTIGENLLNSAESVSPQANGPRISCGNKFRCAERFSHAHHRYTKMVGPTMRSLCDLDITAMQVSSSEPTDILASIAEDEKLKIIYSPLPELGSNGLFQCFCEINYLGETNGQRSVFMGEGNDETNAQRAATINALIFLKEVCTA